MQLRVQQVDAGDLLGDGVLHLHARVGFHEVEAPRLVEVEEEFEGADAAILHLGRQAQGAGDDRVTGGHIQIGAGSDLHQLLVAALQAAFALPQVADDTAAIAEQLHFDMPGAAHALFHVQRATAKGAQGLGGAAGEGLGQLRRIVHCTHAAPATAGQGLEHHAAVLGEKVRGLLRRHRLVDPRYQRHCAAFGQFTGGSFVAEQLQRLGRRADEGQPGILAAAGELSVLGEETVARVDGCTALLAGDGNQLIHIQIGRRAASR